MRVFKLIRRIGDILDIIDEARMDVLDTRKRVKKRKDRAYDLIERLVDIVR